MLADAVAHFLRGFLGEGDGDQRVQLPFGMCRQQRKIAFDQHEGLAAARPGNHDQVLVV